jgi:hypothetical protein
MIKIEERVNFFMHTHHGVYVHVRDLNCSFYYILWDNISAFFYSIFEGMQNAGKKEEYLELW